MATVVSICNRALQKLGAKRITVITEDSKSAKACNACYEELRDVLLRRHLWGFATKQSGALAAVSPAPTWGRANAFELPADFLKLAHDYPEDNTLARDYQVEGRTVVSDMSAPIYIRYVWKCDDPELMDPNFREALACLMAIEMCEELTQSNTKKRELKDDYKLAIAEARKANAFEKVAQVPPTDDWITCRA